MEGTKGDMEGTKGDTEGMRTTLGWGQQWHRWGRMRRGLGGGEERGTWRDMEGTKGDMEGMWRGCEGPWGGDSSGTRGG